MIRVDLHVHTSASYDYQDKDSPIISVLDAAVQAGLDAIAITDHNTFDGYNQLLKELSKARRKQPDKHRALSQLTILPGIEISCLGGRAGLHLLGIFNPETTKLGRVARTLGLKTALPDDLSGGTRLAVHPEQVAHAIHRYGGLVVAPHLGTRNGLLCEYRPELARLVAEACQLDALEYSRETRREQDSYFREAERLARALGVPIIASSDAHGVLSRVHPAGARGVGERYTELGCDQSDFATLSMTLGKPDMVYRGGLDGVREPWRDEERLRQIVRRGKTLTFDYLYSDGDIARIIRVANSLLNTEGGSLLIGVGGGPERVRLGSRRLRLSEGDLEVAIEANVDPTPQIEVLAGDLGDERRVMQVVVDKTANPLFYLTSDGRAYTREKGRAKPMELTCDIIVGPFLREVGRSRLLDATMLMDRTARIRTDRRAALLTPEELLSIFPLRRYLDELSGIDVLLVESIVEAGARVKDGRLRVWAEELSISPAVAERVMGDRARQYHWAQLQIQRYKPLVDRAGVTSRQRSALSASLAALKRQYLRGLEHVVDPDIPLTTLAENLGFLLDWREPRLAERLQALAHDAQADLERLLSATAGRMDTFLLEIGEGALDRDGHSLVQDLLVMPETQVVRRAEEVPGQVGPVLLVPKETPVSLTIEDVLDLFVDEEELEDDQGVRDMLEHIIRLGRSRLPLWIWVRQFSSRAALEGALIELEERREARQNRRHVMRRIRGERTELTLEDMKLKFDELVSKAITGNDADALKCIVQVCLHEATMVESCAEDHRLTQKLLESVSGNISPRLRIFRFAACLLCLVGLEDHISGFIESQAAGPDVPAGIECIALSRGAEAIPILEACLRSERHVMARCAARCLIWIPEYGVSRLKDHLLALSDGPDSLAELGLSAVARAMGTCRAEDYQEAAETLSGWATTSAHRRVRQEALEGLVHMDKRRYLPEAKAKFGWLRGVQQD
jgi:predicted metal-dependent phosphoesterase TrpH